MDSLGEDGHALDRRQGSDSVAEIGNVPVLSEFTDHLLGECL